MKTSTVIFRMSALLSAVLFITILSCSGISKNSVANKTPTKPVVLKSSTEGRAIWVTRGDYRSPEDVVKIVENCEKFNFNQILFQVRGNGTVFYKSEIEPWAYELTSQSAGTTGKDPGWDPLKLAIDEAHKRGIELHAYMNVFPGWRSQKYAPEAVKQLWTAHPDWFMVGKDGKKMIPRDKSVDKKYDTWYSFINPANPEVQKYIESVFLEVVRKYDVDGIHYDYVRYPGEIADYSYDKVSLDRFKLETGKTPTEADDEYKSWRAKQITTIVKNIHDNAVKIKPNIIFSAAVVGEYNRGISTYYQHSREWLAEGILDIAMPMLYKKDVEQFKSLAVDYINNKGKGMVYPGIGVYVLPDEQGLKNMIEAARGIGAEGTTQFSYSSLFNNHVPNAKAEYLKRELFKEKVLPPNPKKYTLK